MEDWPNSSSRSFLYDLSQLPDDMTLEQVLEEYQLTGLIKIKDPLTGEAVQIEPKYKDIK